MEEEEVSSAMASSSLSSSTPSSWSTSSSAAATTTLSKTSQNHRRGPAILPGEIGQLFSLPESIIYYIAMHPSNAKVYKKLIRTCKYFFNRNPILVVNYLGYLRYYDEWTASFVPSVDEPEDKIDLDMVQCKLWITDFLRIDPMNREHKNIAASILSKIYRLDGTLDLTNQSLTFDEFLLLGSNTQIVYLNNNSITENDGEKEVTLEKVIEKLPKIKCIEWLCIKPYCECISSSTVAELIKLPHFANITWLELHNLSESFDAKALFGYIKTHKKKMKVYLNYNEDLSEEYIKEICKILKRIRVTKIFTRTEITYEP